MAIRKPDWFDKHHSEWPPEARTAFNILADGAERILADEHRLQAVMTADEVPDWIARPIDEWPPEYRKAYKDLDYPPQSKVINETYVQFTDFIERCNVEAATPGAAERARERKEQVNNRRMLQSLSAWFNSGIRTAHGLDAKLATEFGISLGKASSIRKAFGFVPAYIGGPLVAPKEAQA